MSLLGKTNNGQQYAQEDLPRPTITYPAAIFEIRETPQGADFVIHTRDAHELYPMDLKYLEAFVAKAQDILRAKKAPGLSVVERHIVKPGDRPA